MNDNEPKAPAMTHVATFTQIEDENGRRTKKEPREMGAVSVDEDGDIVGLFVRRHADFLPTGSGRLTLKSIAARDRARSSRSEHDPERER